jgi:hypothetical protein
MEDLDNEVLKGTKKKLLDQNLINDVLRKAEEIIEQARLEAYQIEELSRKKVELGEGKERLLEYMTMRDMGADAAKEIAQRLKEQLRQIKEIDSILQKPKLAKEKVARIMLPFFGKKQAVLEFIGAQEKSPENWHSYLKEELGNLMNGIRQYSPSAVGSELKKHIREIALHQDGTVTIHGTSQGILSQAGLVKGGELGSIELGPEPAATGNKEKAPRQKRGAYTRKSGVPNRI